MLGKSLKYSFIFHSKKQKDNNKEDNSARINLGDIIIRQIDVELERKSKYDAKTIGYVAIIVFVLTIITGFVKDLLTPIKDNSFINFFVSTSLFRRIYIIIALLVYLVTFVYGAVLLFKCIRILQLKKTGMWQQDELYKIYKKIAHGKIQKEKKIVKNSVDINEINIATNEDIEERISKVSQFLMIFMISFMIVAIVTFISYIVL